MRTALAVQRKEFRQIVRDRRTLMILLFIPIFFLLLYGYALNFDITHVRLGVHDRDHSAESRAIVSAFVTSGYFDLVAAVQRTDELERLLDRNEARAVLVIPEGLARELQAGRDATVQVIINGDNVTTASTVMAYATTIVQSVSTSLGIERVPAAGSARPPVSAEMRVWYNPRLESALFLVPGLIAFIGMITAAVSTALSVVREKERGTWEQVRMAPIDTVSYVIGKTAPYLGLSLLSSAGIILVAMVLFDLPMRGSWLLLIASAVLYLMAALGTGLLISTLAASQLLAFQMVLIVAFLPTMLLSGFVFPIRSAPVAIQMVTFIVPARYFLVALRGIVLKGVGLAELWPQLAALGVYSVVVLGLASVRLARERG
jgi:ABC-2 type transport system permease protein